METFRQIAYASVAHRYRVGQLIGSNIRLEAAVACQPPGPGAEFTAALNQIKALVDHQCLFTQIERFKDHPSTAETMVDYLGQALFAVPAGHARWLSLTLWETGEIGCTRYVNGDLELHVKAFNLTLNLRGPLNVETGLVAVREMVFHSIHAAFITFEEKSFPDQNAWGRELFSNLKHSMPQLHSLRVDLGRQEYLLVPETV